MNRRDVLNHFPWQTKPALFALALLLVSRMLLLVLPIDRMTYVDSRRLQNLFMTDLICELREKTDPEVVLLGTSRTVQLPTKRLERRLKLSPGSVLNLSRGGADFFFLETVLKRNLEVLQGAEVLLIDVVPFQAAYSAEGSEFFLRYASLRQRLDSRSIASKASAVGNFLLPIASHTQDPFQWRMGIHYIDEPPLDRRDRLWRQSFTILGPPIPVSIMASARKNARVGHLIADLRLGGTGPTTPQRHKRRSGFA